MSSFRGRCDVGSRVVVVVFRVRHGRYGGYALRAAHGPAERAALCARRTRHRPPAAPAAPASHNRAPRRRLRDCRDHNLRSFSKSRFFFKIFISHKLLNIQTATSFYQLGFETDVLIVRHICNNTNGRYLFIDTIVKLNNVSLNFESFAN